MVRKSRPPVFPDGGASPLPWFAMVLAARASASLDGGASPLLWFAMALAAHAPASPHGGTSPFLWFAMVRPAHAPASPHGGTSPFLWFAMVGDIPRLAAPTTGGADAMGGWRRRARLSTRWIRARSAAPVQSRPPTALRRVGRRVAAARPTTASRAGKSADIPRSRAIGAAPEGIVAAIVPRTDSRSYFRRCGRAIGGFGRWGIDISFAPTVGLSPMVGSTWSYFPPGRGKVPEGHEGRGRGLASSFRAWRGISSSGVPAGGRSPRFARDDGITPSRAAGSGWRCSRDCASG